MYIWAMYIWAMYIHVWAMYIWAMYIWAMYIHVWAMYIWAVYGHWLIQYGMMYTHSFLCCSYACCLPRSLNVGQQKLIYEQDCMV